jgi:hypothetical protein
MKARMKTFLIQFYSQRKRAPRGAAFLDLDIEENELVARVKEFGGDPNCKHCRGRAVAEQVIDAAYAQKIAPGGRLEATVHDVSADPRVTEDRKRRLLNQNDVAASVEGIGTSGAVH